MARILFCQDPAVTETQATWKQEMLLVGNQGEAKSNLSALMGHSRMKLR